VHGTVATHLAIASCTNLRLPIFHGVLAFLGPVDGAISFVLFVLSQTLLAFSHHTSIAGFSAERHELTLGLQPRVNAAMEAFGGFQQTGSQALNLRRRHYDGSQTGEE